ncbi:MAG: RNA polymerase sigma factor [FCB group bacterium]|nr:RNA polymerase sigma factor [FCB group bacterium]
MNERELVKRAKAGDYDAFTTLVNDNKNKIYSLAIKMIGNTEDAEDIVQETLLKAIDNIDRFREESSFGTWLYSIALNQARALLTKQKQTDLKPIEEYLPTKSAEDLHKKSIPNLFEWKDPHKELEDEELKKIIDKVIDSLPWKYKEVFLLRYLEELPIKEIAKIINESVASTKSRVLRAKLAIREQLSKVFKERYGEKMFRLH